MKPPSFEYVAAHSLDEAIASLAEHGDGVLPPDEVAEEQQRSEEAEPPERFGDDALPLPLAGDPLQDHAAGEGELDDVAAVVLVHVPDEPAPEGNRLVAVDVREAAARLKVGKTALYEALATSST